MRHLPLLLAGIAVLAVAGTAALASDTKAPPHEMTIRLPGGGIERIEYTGNVAPRLVINSGPFDAWPAPIAFGFDPSFAMLDRVAADMDREMAFFRDQAEAMQRASLQAVQASQGLSNAALATLPRGTASFSMMSTWTGNGGCTRMVQVTTPANGGTPEVIKRSSGDCEGDAGVRHSLSGGSAAPHATGEPVPIRFETPQATKSGRTIL